VEVVGAVDEFDVVRMKWVWKSETIVHSRKQEGASERVIAAVADRVGGKKAAGMSWIRHISDRVLTA
jgi:hypothetical protein